MLFRAALLVLFFSFFTSAVCATKEYNFRHITVDDGLSNSNINAIVQDLDGFMWFGTDNGLNKYDGYNFTTYYSNGEKGSLTNDVIQKLYVDHSGVLWVGSFYGLFRYNPLEDNFVEIPLIYKGENLATKPILSIIEDADGIMWFGTSGNGIICFDKQKGITQVYSTKSASENKISSDFILEIVQDSHGVIWIGTEHNGFDRFDKSSNRFVNINVLKSFPLVTGSNSVIQLVETENHCLFVGTRGEGLFEYNDKTKTLRQIWLSDNNKPIPQPKELYTICRDKKGQTWISSSGTGLYTFSSNPAKTTRIFHTFNNSGSIISDNIRGIYEDRQSNLWVISFQGGINVLPNKHQPFKTYNFFDENVTTINNTVTSIAQDKKGNIWVGIDGGGIKKINPSRTQIEHLYPETQNVPFVKDRAITALMLDKSNNLWLGSYLEGLVRYNLDTKATKQFKSGNGHGSLSYDYVTSILQDAMGNIWVATNGGGLNLFDPKTETFKYFTQYDTLNPSRVINNWINVLTEDNNNRIWIGTFWGLSVYDPYTNQFLNYLANEENPNSLSNNIIYCIFEASTSDIWIGTRSGLNKFSPEINGFKSYNVADGIPGTIIFAIQEDNKGTLWLSTNRGLCNFNPITLETTNYFASDGLQNDEFTRNAAYKSPSGELFFGGIDGLSTFYPDSLDFKYDVPVPVITEFRIFNTLIKPNTPFENRIVLKNPIYKADTIVIKEKDKLVSFDIAALDYILPEKNNYKCILEGFEKEWRLLDYKQRRVTFTNLDAGTYKFKIKASSINNQWNSNERVVTLIVKPPFYKSWWSYVLYYLFLLGLIYGIWLFSIRRVKFNNQLKLERLEREKENELNQAKLRFFTNISHEFRTPITLIVGPLQKMMMDKALAKKYHESIVLMLKNANRLLRMVNQIMDIRKVESGNMKLKTENTDLIAFLTDIYESFKTYAEQKEIDFRFKPHTTSQFCWLDPDKVDKIVFNLLSNAFKFTPAKGQITLVSEIVTDQQNQKQISISVIDTGKGIPTEDQDKIFQRFFQTTKPGQATYLGSGVGLSLSKNLSEIHHGNLSFTSVYGRGTTFTFTFPIDEAAYPEHERNLTETPGVDKYLHISPEFDPNLEITVANPLESGEKLYSVLIVEDNPDLRQYIKSELGESFHTFEAKNGLEGLNMALELMPDIVITDVMMPEMDGLELCSNLKSNFITNHIPVIMLTAKASIENRIAGIERGADSYIPKPFHPDHLKIRIRKLLELRNTLKSKYSNFTVTEEMPENPGEDLYLKEITTYIMDHLDQPDLNIEVLCKELGISRAHFYRKIKMLTDKSPTEFVRYIRLNEAARLLTQQEKSVSEVGYAVGFSSPSYFSICFKEQFNLSPTEFIKRLDKNQG